jgi:hypothetical protein
MIPHSIQLDSCGAVSRAVGPQRARALRPERWCGGCARNKELIPASQAAGRYERRTWHPRNPLSDSGVLAALSRQAGGDRCGVRAGGNRPGGGARAVDNAVTAPAPRIISTSWPARRACTGSVRTPTAATSSAASSEAGAYRCGSDLFRLPLAVWPASSWG